MICYKKIRAQALQPQVHQLLLRRLKSCPSLLQVLPTRDDLRRFREQFAAFLARVGTRNPESLIQDVFKTTIAVQAEDELVVNGVGDVVDETFIRDYRYVHAYVKVVSGSGRRSTYLGNRPGRSP